MKTLALLSILSLPAFGQLWSGVLDPARAIDWSGVGVPGGIPTTRTQCGSTIAAYTGTAGTINTALAGCGSGHYVQLGAGTFTLSAGITFANHSNITLRGMGANQTFLVFSDTVSCLGFSSVICLASSDLNYSLSQSNTGNFTAGYSQGSTSITLSSKTNLAVGNPMVLDQLDDTSDSGDIFVCYVSNGTLNCSSNGDNGGFARTNRGQQQVVTVTSISSGSCPCTVGISPGLYMPNWDTSKTPQAWWATSPILNAGVESLSIDASTAEPSVGSGFAIEIFNCAGCWVKGIRSIQPGRSHVQMQIVASATVQDNYFYRTAGQTSTSYGFESAAASGILIQNNIFQQITEPMSLNGSCSGCVEGYNFDINDLFQAGGVYTWRMASSLPHAVGISHVLIEGNQGSGLQADAIHGSHHFITAHRNTWNGYQKNNGTNPTGNAVPIILNSYNRFFNLIGNVLGTSALPNNGYESGTHPIYQIGGGETATYVVAPDSNVARTLMRWGNWDYVTNAVRWCGNSSSTGWGTTCSSTSEVPSGITNYSNPVPSAETLPASFYLSSKPSFFASAKAWPPIGPDVSGGNLANLGGHANSIPAADCYSTTMGGSADGTGSVLSFNASTCYSAAAAPTGSVTGGKFIIGGKAIIK